MLLLCRTENLSQFPTLNTDMDPGTILKPRAEHRSLPSLL